LIAVGGTFLGSLIALTIVTGIIARSVRSGSLSSIDRTLGFIFGLARGAFILCLAYLLLDFIQPAERPTWIKEAKSAPYLQHGADILRTVLPEKWREKTSAGAEELLQKTRSADDAAKAIRALSNPTAPTQPASDSPAPPSYKPGDQKALDRIINNQR
jgi:membrane protein required for colicin V production